MRNLPAKILFLAPFIATVALADYSGPTTTYTGVVQGGPPQAISVLDARVGAKCDGTTDDTAALATAQTIAGIGGSISIPSNLTCRGKPNDTVARITWIVNGALKGPDGMTGEVFQCSAAGIVIEGTGTIDGDRAGASSSIGIYGAATDGCTGLTVSPGLNVAHTTSYGIEVADVPYTTINGTSVTDNGNTSIFANLTGSSDVPGLRIQNNNVDRVAEGTNLTQNGIQVTDGVAGPGPGTHKWTGVTYTGNRVYMPFSPLNNNVASVIHAVANGTYSNNFTSGGTLGHSLVDSTNVSGAGNVAYGAAGFGFEIARSHNITEGATGCDGAIYAATLQHCVTIDGYSSHVVVTGIKSINTLTDALQVYSGASVSFTAAASNGGLIQLTVPSTAGLVAGADGTPLDVTVATGDTGPQGRRVIQSVDDTTHVTLAGTTFVATSTGSYAIVIHDISVNGLDDLAATSNQCALLRDVQHFTLSGINCSGVGDTTTDGIDLQQSWPGTVSGTLHDLTNAVKYIDTNPDTLDYFTFVLNLFNNTNNFASSLSGGAALGLNVTKVTPPSVITPLLSAPQVSIGGNLTAPAWGTAGLGLTGTASTYTDSTTSGTIADEASFALPIVTVAATNAATTITDLSTLRIPAPLAGTNVTATNLWSLKAIGAVKIGGLLQSNLGANITGATDNFNANANFNTNINTGTSTGTIIIGNSGNTGKTTIANLATNAAENAVCNTSAGLLSTAAVAACTGISSKKFKNRIAPLKYGLALVMVSKPKVFFYNKGVEDSGAAPHYGLIAEDVAKIDPELVVFDKEGKPLSWRWNEWEFVLTNAIQDQEEEIHVLWGIIFLLICAVIFIGFRVRKLGRHY